MNQRQYPHRFAVNLVPEAVAFVRYQLAGPGILSRLAHHGVLDQPGGRVAENLIYPGRRAWIVGCDVVPHIGAVLLRFGRPNNPHAWFGTLARRAANSASTSSFDRPNPARIEARPAST